MRLPLTLPPKTTSTFDVVAFGESSLDFVGRIEPVLGSARRDKIPLARLDLQPGGQAATAAVASARLGARARYVGALGRDDWAAQIRDGLARERVDLVAVELPDARTRAALVLVAGQTGERTVYESRDDRLTIDPAILPLPEVLAGRTLLVDGVHLPAAIAAARAARRRAIPTMVDVDTASERTAELLEAIDVIIVPAGFALEYTGEGDVGAALQALGRRFGPGAVIATLGPEGSLARCGGREIATRGYEIDVVDTTGAGDAFRGGLAAAWTRYEMAPLAELLEFANATAALNCRDIGAQSALPDWDQLEALVASRLSR